MVLSAEGFKQLASVSHDLRLHLLMNLQTRGAVLPWLSSHRGSHDIPSQARSPEGIVHAQAFRLCGLTLLAPRGYEASWGESKAYNEEHSLLHLRGKLNHVSATAECLHGNRTCSKRARSSLSWKNVQARVDVNILKQMQVIKLNIGDFKCAAGNASGSALPTGPQQAKIT